MIEGSYLHRKDAQTGICTLNIFDKNYFIFESGPSSDGPDYRKGNGLIFPYQDVDNEWQHKRNWGRWREPREEFSFLFNSSVDLGIGLTGDKV